MPSLTGVTKATRKNGQTYYRTSITYLNKHISLGSYDDEISGNFAYLTASEILRENMHTIDDYNSSFSLPFEKWVILINFRDNGMYFKNPIYLKNRYFVYYINKKKLFKFDIDDLFYYAHHKIMVRGGHLFVSDYGMQVNILSRYGIRNYAVTGRDYRFVNGDDTDYRYANIEVINKYYGVIKEQNKGFPSYTAKIHIKGDFIIGRYSTEQEAAIAYNKAARILKDKGLQKDFPENYINTVDEIEYARIYHSVRISKKIRNYTL
ncbi:hypothetical protein acsn021_09300 [Anaerocolumna cellulosilytica]|uniref:Uncharacterized protein n=1 Tax=Anaerocolumna cellulosilytica TaxID=433286 RepID=A0A6S6R2F3_9FIRM|nr:hypothetical protein [Anaerocolumna cellulosilytica]MBB5194417.1 hypothetical protein [Anaerocolumna cellulosilytica]BCJ93361.1 hypothetical protein acsn021_09300 [Anaerocolumna cellulosilytica]